MKKKPQGIEALTIRRAVVADADKVRYRVYSSPTEFIAVIAESALMAVKVSGIAKPHKIVRDLPTEGIAIEAKKMAARDMNANRVTLNTKHPEAPASWLVAEIPTLDPAAKTAAFKPMQIGDLQRRSSVRVRILPPEMLNEIIEQHSKSSLPPPPADEPIAPVTPVAEAVQPVIERTPPVVPEPTTEERLLQMAQEILPSAPVDNPDRTLTPEEVEKLLNG